MSLSMFIAAFSSIAVILIVIDFYFAWKSFQKTEEIGRFLGASAFSAGIITICYVCSIRGASYLNTSISSSMYFIGIDWMLVSLVHFVYLFTGRHRTKASERARFAIRIVAALDSVILFVNIFKEIAVTYIRRDTVIAPYTYGMKPLYYGHLIFTYTLVILCVYILIMKIRKTPRQYRNQYHLIIAAIAFVVIVNAIFLYPTGNELYTLVDYSIIGYSVGLYIMYWAAFEYRHKNMLESLSMTVFQNIDQGLVLFDYEDGLIMHNRKSKHLFPGVDFDEHMTGVEFLDRIGVSSEAHPDDSYSIQCSRNAGRKPGEAYIYHAGISRDPLRCDYRRLRDHYGNVTGNLFVFTESTNDTDLLTGFQNWETFRRFAAENPYNFDHPTAVVVFDILGLGEVNRTFGHEVGDQRIRNLVKVMREHMPEDTYYVRGYEAHLVAICYHCGEDDIYENVQEIIRTCGETVQYGMSATADASLMTTDRRTRAGIIENRNVITAVETAARTLQVKKLLNTSSVHSQTLTSLVRALQESDSDTESHVERTQKMGALLGKRIGLSDAQQADLSLLCLLHDIGKIGIPLEILNKPGKLTDAEWGVLRTHAEKGYQIAMSSDELKGIAQMILCHHERWDGKGYPEKIAGQNIPVLSRVIAIVDAYDAMVNNRSYRKGLTPERAQEEIRRCAGTQFDPYLAEEFLQMLAENPELAKGERTGGDEVRSFKHEEDVAAAIGNTVAVAYSRYLLDIDEKIVEVDGYFTELTGYSAGDVVGRLSQFDLIPSEDRAHYMLQVNNQFKRSSLAYLEHDILRKDGRKIRVYCVGKRYYDSAVKAFRSEILISRAEGNGTTA